MERNSIFIRSIYKKKNFNEFENLGLGIKYHDDSRPKNHFEESDIIVAILIAFGVDVIRDLLKDAAKSGLKRLIKISSSIFRKFASKTVYKLTSRTKEEKVQQFILKIDDHHEKLVLNMGDNFEELLIDYVERYLAQKFILRKTTTSEGLESYSIGYYDKNREWNVIQYEGKTISNCSKEECDEILTDLKSIK